MSINDELQSCWVMILLLNKKKGVDNSAADALSRLPPVLEFGLLSVVGSLNTDTFLDQVKGDDTLNHIL